MEEWLPVVGYEKNYKVSNFGSVFSFISNRILKGSIDKDGYRCVELTRGHCDCKTLLVHRLVLEAFRGLAPKDKPDTNHLNCDRLNNSINNLEWISAGANNRYRHSLGRSAAGERNGFSKLNETKVGKIRLYEGLFSTKQMAQMFSVSTSAIERVLNGKYWKSTIQEAESHATH